MDLHLFELVGVVDELDLGHPDARLQVSRAALVAVAVAVAVAGLVTVLDLDLGVGGDHPVDPVAIDGEQCQDVVAEADDRPQEVALVLVVLAVAVVVAVVVRAGLPGVVLVLVVHAPTIDPEPERALRVRLGDILVQGVTPSDRDAELIAILRAADLVRHVVDKEHRKAAKQRAKEIEAHGPASPAVKAVVEEVNAAMVAAVAAGSAAGVVGSS